MNKFALISCLCFLVGNITFDILDTPEHPADYRIYYLPLSIMIFALILVARKSTVGTMRTIWSFFMWLAVGQVVKFLITNPFIQMISDYLFLAIVTIGTLYKLAKNADR